MKISFIKIKLRPTCTVPSIGEVSSEGVGLVRGLPLRRRAIVVICVDIVIVYVDACQQRTPEITAIRCNINATNTTSHIIFMQSSIECP